MKKYQHKKDKYVVEARKDSDNNCYKVYGYRCCGCPPSADWSVNISVKDFEALFEPINEYCCDQFEECVQNGVIVAYQHLKIVDANTPVSQVNYWRWNTVYKVLDECPFCGKRIS